MSGKKDKKERRDADDVTVPDTAQLSFADVEKWDIPPFAGNSVEIGSLASPMQDFV